MDNFCNDCRATFSDPDYFDPGTGESFGCCPECGSEDIDDASVCEVCGEYAGSEEMKDGMCPDCAGQLTPCKSCEHLHLPHELSNGLCDDCRAELWKRYTDFLEGLKDHERAALMETIEDAARCA